LKSDNGSLPWEIVFVVLFHLGGQLMFPSPMLSLPKEKGHFWGGLTSIMLCSPPYLMISIMEPLIVYHYSVMVHGPLSHEKKGIKAHRLMQLLYVYDMYK
jgi:hypothetical protein